jgi:hypothetical protein
MNTNDTITTKQKSAMFAVFICGICQFVKFGFKGSKVHCEQEKEHANAR